MLKVVLNFIMAVRYLLMYGVLSFVWLLFFMLWFDRFIPPFDGLVKWLTPWKEMYIIPMDAELSDRMSLMQLILDRSERVAEVSFVMLIVSFAFFSGYLTYVYQQRKRRAEENQLLLLKNQEISRRNEFIRYISATISHEFKNNLGRVKRRVDLLEGLPADARYRIDGNFDKLFADIEIFKKIADEREASLVEFKRVDICAMLEKLSRQYADFIEFTLDDKHPKTTIFTSDILMRTVFENLFDNSIKYKKPSQARAKIAISSGMDTDGTRRYFWISFRDEGIGMNEEQADQCFYKGMGTGLGWGEGLYFVKYVIGLHAGKIRVGKEYTAPDIGTEIIIHLPFVEEAESV